MQTLPYCGAPPVPGAVSWNLDPILLSSLVIAAAVYVHVARRLAVPGVRQASFMAGWALLSAALVSPLCNLSVALFSARIGQHMLIEFLAAPLIAWGLPWELGGRNKGVSFALFGAVPFAVALWFWHLPAAYDWTFRSVAAYWSMHVSLLLAAVLLWKVLLERRNAGASLLASGLTTAQMTVLGAIYTFAGRALFSVHFGTTGVWGLSPLDDQRLGGLIMWIPPGLALAAVAMWTLAELLSDGAAPAPQRFTTARE